MSAKPYRITARDLQGACSPMKDIFLAEWPDGADLTEANMTRAIELGLGVDDVAGFFFAEDDDLQEAFATEVAPMWTAAKERRGIRGLMPSCSVDPEAWNRVVDDYEREAWPVLLAMLRRMLEEAR